MLSELLLLILTLVTTFIGATWIERDKHREREDALLDALDDAVDTISNLEAQISAITSHPSVRRLTLVEDGTR